MKGRERESEKERCDGRGGEGGMEREGEIVREKANRCREV